ncbi:MAG: LytTR family DNA-binding domain-containing protein [Pseudomonadota bacterium]
MSDSGVGADKILTRPKPIPRAYFQDRAAFDRFVRHHLMLHPFWLMMIFAAPIFKATGTMLQEFQNISQAADIALLSLRIALYFALKAWLFPAVLWHLLPRNVPYIVLHHGFFFALCVPSALILFPFHDDTLLQALTRFGRQQAFAAVLTVLVVFFFERSIRDHLGHVGAFVPVFWPVEIAEKAQADGVYLAPDLGGIVVAMQAQNQYVQVTTTTERRLLRMTLSQAIEALPAGTGLRVHRSWWVNRSQMGDFAFDRKEFILKGQGLDIPVSRANRGEVDDLLNPRLAA